MSASVPTAPNHAMRIRGVVFDAYGTLFDVHTAVVRASVNVAADVGLFSQRWRQRQLERTWLSSLMGRFEDFETLTRSALDSVLCEFQVKKDDALVDRLMEAYLTPPLFPDVRPVLDLLRDLPLLILSNGSPKMLEAAVRENGLTSVFADVVSVDRVRIYKPSPQVYTLGTEALGLAAAEVLFVSSNWWDAMGAKAFGYRVCWCNRGGAATDFPNFAPDFVVAQLEEVAGLIGN